MKKLLSLVLTIAIILGAVFTAKLILAEAEAPAREGGYMHVSGRGNQNSGPRQYLGDALKASGDGTYQLSAWVRIPGNTAEKSVILMVYTGAYPQVSGKISNGEWTLISGEIAISGTANLANNEGAYFRIQTGSALTDNWDIDFDSIVLKKKTGDTYGENLIQDSACELSPLSTWFGTSSTIANPDSNDTSLYGVQVEYISDGNLFISKKDQFNFCLDGNKAEVTVYNAGTENITVGLQIRTAGWSTIGGNNQWNTIAPGEAKTITTEIDEANVANDNWAVLVANGANKTGKLILCNLTAQQAISLKDAAKWNVNTGTTPTVVANPEAAQPSPETSPETSPSTSPVPSPTTPDLKAEGAYITVTDRGNQNSGPIQYLGDTLKASGDGKYYISAWVKLPNFTEEKSVSIIIYTGGYPQVSKKITNGEWTLISGEIDITGTSGFANNKSAYFRIQTGSDLQADNWDIWFDGMTLNKKNADGSYGNNLLVNGDCSTDDITTWGETTSCTVAFAGLGSDEAPKQPTGVIITALEETETNHIVTNKGVVTKDDIKDGKISKSFTIINQGEEPVKVTFSLQCLHKNEDNEDMWSAPETGFTALIEPGDKQELTYTMNVNDDGTITVSGGNNDMDHKPEEFFARFDILEADGNPKVLKGTKLLILNTNPDIKFSAGAKDAITVEVTYSKQYDTSDMIPLSAFVLLPAIVAFAIVMKKRKEN